MLYNMVEHIDTPFLFLLADSLMHSLATMHFSGAWHFDSVFCSVGLYLGVELLSHMVTLTFRHGQTRTSHCAMLLPAVKQYSSPHTCGGIVTFCHFDYSSPDGCELAISLFWFVPPCGLQWQDVVLVLIVYVLVWGVSTESLCHLVTGLFVFFIKLCKF